jgi:methylmalonyl-CoA carboxyltransferase large subunit
MVKTSQILKELQSKLAELEARNEKLEARLKELEHPVSARAPLPAPQPAPAPKEPEISEEIMLVIAAAVAAYLGERAHIRVARLVSSHAWAQQGRVSIQASHRLA